MHRIDQGTLSVSQDANLAAASASINLNGGTLNTNGTIVGSVTINNGATFSGNFTVLGTLTGVGPNSIISVGNSPGAAVAGSLAGVTTQIVEVQFNNAGAPANGTTHDFLHVTGNVTGTHTVNVLPFAPSNAPTPTTGNGIELFRVGGAVAANAFSPSGPVIQGGFHYLLKHLPDYAGMTDGFFLQSAAIQEISLNASLLSASRASNMACSHRNHGHPGLDGVKGRVWAEGSEDNLSSDAANGLDYDVDTSCYRAGFVAQAGGNLQIGLSGGLTSAAVDVNLPQGLATMNGDGVLVQGSAAWVKGQKFVEANLGYASTDWTIVKAASAGVVTATIDGLTGHLGAGYRTPFFGPVTAMLSVGIDYGGTACGGSCLVAGATEEVSNWSAGVHARFDAAFYNDRVKPYAQLGLTTDLDGGTTVSFGGASTTVDAMSGLAHADLGLEARVWSNLAVFVQGGVIEGLDSETTGYSAKIGAKLAW